MPKAMIYCRVSSAEQVEGTSLATQESACRDWCKRNNLDVESVYVDAGESAKTADRPQFLRMVADCQSRKDINRVVVYRLDRFARNTLDHGVYAHKLKKAGAYLASVCEPITDDPGGRMMENIYAAVAQFDNDVRSARAKDAMRSIKARGGWTHKPPWGFRIERIDGIPKLVPDTEQIPIIQKAFALVIAGQNPQAVFESLRPVASRSTFYRAFRDELYAQIDPEQFRKVQYAMGHARPRSNRATDFPLRGVLLCSVCGKPLTASMARGKWAYYHCKTPGHARIPLPAVDEAIRGILADISGPIQLSLPGIRRMIAETAQQSAGQARADVGQAKSEIARLERRLDKLKDALLDERITGQDFDQRKQSIEAEISRKRLILSAAGKAEASGFELLLEAESIVSDFAEMWNRITPANRPRLIRSMFPRGIIIDGKTVRTSASDSIFGILCASDTGFFRMAPPTGWASNLRDAISLLRGAA